MINRSHQFVLIVFTIIGSWLGMQAVHELGHVVGAKISGGKVEKVVLHPLTISRTDLEENPHPLFVVWAGPIVGVGVPLLMWLIADRMKLPFAFLLRFFAGFCLIANGAYISLGSFDRIGDCGEMLRHGSSPWHLWLFGLLTIPIGFWLWHKQGTHFGLSPKQRPINKSAVYLSIVLGIGLILLGFVIGGD